MLYTKGTFNKNGEIVLRQDNNLNILAVNDKYLPLSPSVVKIEISVSIDLNDLISGFDGFIWATKNSRQAEIICNAIKVQNIELEIIKVKHENTDLYLIRVLNINDVKTVVNFLQNDKSGLRLKPDWTYPDGETNHSFEQWIDH
ncbi:MAG TPA: hypothetical protein VLA03_08880 [Draconibacterium sp.]|nr:hypothetical protein [Draconibacterium sp.]